MFRDKRTEEEIRKQIEAEQLPIVFIGVICIVIFIMAICGFLNLK